MAAATAVVVGGYLATCLFAAISPTARQRRPSAEATGAVQPQASRWATENGLPILPQHRGAGWACGDSAVGDLRQLSRRQPDDERGARSWASSARKARCLKPIRVSLEDNDPGVVGARPRLCRTSFTSITAPTSNERRQLRFLPRPDRQDGNRHPSRTAVDEVVPRLPPQSRLRNIRDPELVTQLDFVPEDPEALPQAVGMKSSMSIRTSAVLRVTASGIRTGDCRLPTRNHLKHPVMNKPRSIKSNRPVQSESARGLQSSSTRRLIATSVPQPSLHDRRFLPPSVAATDGRVAGARRSVTGCRYEEEKHCAVRVSAPAPGARRCRYKFASLAPSWVAWLEPVLGDSVLTAGRSSWTVTLQHPDSMGASTSLHPGADPGVLRSGSPAGPSWRGPEFSETKF